MSMIFVDPGHGGSDPGAVNDALPLDEKDVVLAVGGILRDRLREAGHRVKMSRSQDEFIGLDRRAKLANDWGADLFVSLHCNASHPDTIAEGIETWHFPGSRKGGELAKQVQSSMIDAFDTHRNRGVKEASFAVLRKTLMTATLVELEFISPSKRQGRFLERAGNHEKLADAIASGLDRFLA